MTTKISKREATKTAYTMLVAETVKANPHQRAIDALFATAAGETWTADDSVEATSTEIRTVFALVKKNVKATIKDLADRLARDVFISKDIPTIHANGITGYASPEIARAMGLNRAIREEKMSEGTCAFLLRQINLDGVLPLGYSEAQGRTWYVPLTLH